MAGSRARRRASSSGVQVPVSVGLFTGREISGYEVEVEVEEDGVAAPLEEIVSGVWRLEKRRRERWLVGEDY